MTPLVDIITIVKLPIFVFSLTHSSERITTSHRLYLCSSLSFVHSVEKLPTRLESLCSQINTNSTFQCCSLVHTKTGNEALRGGNFPLSYTSRRLEYNFAVKQKTAEKFIMQSVLKCVCRSSLGEVKLVDGITSLILSLRTK
jgi:hypothetical protein